MICQGHGYPNGNVLPWNHHPGGTVADNQYDHIPTHNIKWLHPRPLYQDVLAQKIFYHLNHACQHIVHHITYRPHYDQFIVISGGLAKYQCGFGELKI